MAEMLIAYNNAADTATLSGGSYVSTMPLTNLQNIQLGILARSTDLALTSTRFKMAMPSSTLVRVLALANHNLSLSAKHRLRYTIEASTLQNHRYTENLGSWGISGATVGVDALVAPDGNTTMDVLIESSLNEVHQVLTSGVFLANSQNIFSVFIKPQARAAWFIQFSSTYIPSSPGVFFALTGNGAVHFADPGITAGVTLVSPGVYRVWLYGTSTTGATSGNIFITSCDASFNNSYLGTGATTAGIWGSQLEPGNVMTSYYPNTTSTAGVTRPLGYMDWWQPYSYDTGWIDVWPPVYTTLSLNWQDDNFWGGRYLASDLAGYNKTLVAQLPTGARPSSFTWQIDDSASPVAYVQYGRLFQGAAWQPVYNAEFGATLGWETNTGVQEAISGAEFFDAKTPYRVARATFANMSEDEGLGGPFEIMRRSGLDKEILFLWDPADTLHATRRQFLARLRALNPLEFPDGFINNTYLTGNFRSTVAVEIKERVA